ncbi:ABC transporter ATP-binding protein [Acidisoma sp. 7E03]
MSAIVFEGISKSYRGRPALADLDLAIADQTLTVFCGPPAAGKSVLFRLLVGLEQPDRGRILIDGTDVTRLAAADRLIGYVPQSFALFPHMSVYANIAYPLRQQGAKPADIERRVGEAAEILRITRLLQKKPSQLSGGEKQRAAIARGMLKDARIFILDDPLVGLDFKLRESLMEDLKDMRATLRATFLYATSDSLEALTMAEDLVVMDGGRVVEAGPVADLYHRPARVRSAELIGFPRCNLLPAARETGGYRNALLSLPLSGVGSEATFAVRPEHVVHAPDHPGAFRGEITLMENLGAECVVYLTCQGLSLVSIPASDAVAGLDVGSPYPFVIEARHVAAFDGATGTRLEAANHG